MKMSRFYTFPLKTALVALCTLAGPAYAEPCGCYLMEFHNPGGDVQCSAKWNGTQSGLSYVGTSPGQPGNVPCPLKLCDAALPPGVGPSCDRIVSRSKATPTHVSDNFNHINMSLSDPAILSGAGLVQ